MAWWHLCQLEDFDGQSAVAFTERDGFPHAGQIYLLGQPGAIDLCNRWGGPFAILMSLLVTGGGRWLFPEEQGGRFANPHLGELVCHDGV